MKRVDDADATQALKLLMQDHRRIRRLLRHAEAVDADPVAQARAVDLACRAFDEHTDIEQRLLYPLLGNGAAGAASDHQVAARLIAVLDGTGPADAVYLPTLRDLAAWVDEHVREEETSLLPHAKAAGVDLRPLAVALVERQRHGALTDVDVDAAFAEDAQDGVGQEAEARNARQRSRAPGRRGGAH